VGAGNRYGHPAPQTLSALRNGRVPVRRTDRDGTVVVDAEPGAIRVQALS
jgi:competence protein ComEC